jgi:hypothetical protein
MANYSEHPLSCSVPPVLTRQLLPSDLSGQPAVLMQFGRKEVNELCYNRSIACSARHFLQHAFTLRKEHVVLSGNTIIMFETEAYMGYLLLGEIGGTVL